MHQLKRHGTVNVALKAVSINNGVMVMRGKRWPLMIDPQSQASANGVERNSWVHVGAGIEWPRDVKEDYV